MPSPNSPPFPLGFCQIVVPSPPLSGAQSLPPAPLDPPPMGLDKELESVSHRDMFQSCPREPNTSGLLGTPTHPPTHPHTPDACRGGESTSAARRAAPPPGVNCAALGWTGVGAQGRHTSLSNRE